MRPALRPAVLRPLFEKMLRLAFVVIPLVVALGCVGAEEFFVVNQSPNTGLQPCVAFDETTGLFFYSMTNANNPVEELVLGSCNASSCGNTHTSRVVYTAQSGCSEASWSHVLTPSQLVSAVHPVIAFVKRMDANCQELTAGALQCDDSTCTLQTETVVGSSGSAAGTSCTVRMSTAPKLDQGGIFRPWCVLKGS